MSLTLLNHIYYFILLFYSVVQNSSQIISSCLYNLPGNVAVTSLLHMKQAALLVAGYNFGCFQIWDLQSMQAM